VNNKRVTGVLIATEPVCLFRVIEPEPAAVPPERFDSLIGGFLFLLDVMAWQNGVNGANFSGNINVQPDRIIMSKIFGIPTYLGVLYACFVKIWKQFYEVAILNDSFSFHFRCVIIVRDSKYFVEFENIPEIFMNFDQIFLVKMITAYTVFFRFLLACEWRLRNNFAFVFKSENTFANRWDFINVYDFHS
jgi:hypothetical protein